MTGMIEAMDPVLVEKLRLWREAVGAEMPTAKGLQTEQP
jgi:hypothetical protein